MQRPTPCSVLFPIGLLSLAGVAQGQPPAAEESEQIRAARQNVAIISIRDTDSGTPFEHVEDPVLQFTEPVRGNVFGTLWVWGRTGRPAAVLELLHYCQPQTGSCLDWFCFHATTDRPIELTAATGEKWTPQSSQLAFEPLPDAPLPAATALARSVQMKQFIRRFTAHEFYVSGRVELRLLPSAIHRYEDPQQGVIDGAIFVMAEGTHPEATLFLEAIQPADEPDPHWQYAIGRSGGAEMVMSYDGEEVHRVPAIDTFPPSTHTYWRMLRTTPYQESAAADK